MTGKDDIKRSPNEDCNQRNPGPETISLVGDGFLSFPVNGAQTFEPEHHHHSGGTTDFDSTMSQEGHGSWVDSASDRDWGNLHGGSTLVFNREARQHPLRHKRKLIIPRVPNLPELFD